MAKVAKVHGPGRKASRFELRKLVTGMRRSASSGFLGAGRIPISSILALGPHFTPSREPETWRCCSCLSSTGLT
jgi:hypothetical protein